MEKFTEAAVAIRVASDVMRNGVEVRLFHGVFFVKSDYRLSLCGSTGLEHVI